MLMLLKSISETLKLLCWFLFALDDLPHINSRFVYQISFFLVINISNIHMSWCFGLHPSHPGNLATAGRPCRPASHFQPIIVHFHAPDAKGSHHWYLTLAMAWFSHCLPREMCKLLTHTCVSYHTRKGVVWHIPGSQLGWGHHHTLHY